MADVVKTLKIKKAGAPGAVSPSEPVPEAVPAAAPAAPVQGATLPKYAQIPAPGAAAAPVVRDSRPWTAWAIVATVAVLAMLALIVFQLVELNFYASPPTVWTHPGMF